MIAEIEAFLRTGEGPPAAPEPARALPPRSQPFRMGGPASGPDTWPGADAPTGPGGVAGPPRPGRGRPRPEGDGGFLSPWRIRLGRMWGRSYAGGYPFPGPPRRGAGGGSGAGRLSRARAGAATGTGAPPRWTPLRVFVVSTLLLALMVLPVLWSDRANTTNPDGPDGASPAPAGLGYAFLAVDKTGRPFRWDPCRPVYYRTDLAAAPSWAAADLERAVEQVSVATGIDFVDQGDTTAVPPGGSAAGGVTTGAGTPQHPAPVLIDWATPAQSAQMHIADGQPGTEAMARTEPVAAVDELTGRGVYVTGTVTLDASAAGLAAGFGPGGLGVLLMQQVGRLMGLAYTDSGGQVMNPTVLSSAVTSFGAGDRAGLGRLGRGSGCLQLPANSSLEPTL